MQIATFRRVSIDLPTANDATGDVIDSSRWWRALILHGNGIIVSLERPGSKETSVTRPGVTAIGPEDAWRIQRQTRSRPDPP